LQAPAPGMEASCTLTPELEEGPYYLDDILFRSNITEDQIGIPLVLRFKVVNTDCEPLADTFVDIWQCNGTGFYCGYTRELLLHLLHDFSLNASTMYSPLPPNHVCSELCWPLIPPEAALKVSLVSGVVPGCVLSCIHASVHCMSREIGTPICSRSEHSGCLALVLLSMHSVDSG
jgi:hypothetical protein